MSTYYNPIGAALAGTRLSGGEIASEHRFGEAVPLTEGLRLIADYLDGLNTALTRHAVDLPRPLDPYHTVLPAWSAFLRGQSDRCALLLETKETVHV
jgi:hypothetical protein